MSCGGKSSDTMMMSHEQSTRTPTCTAINYVRNLEYMYVIISSYIPLYIIHIYNIGHAFPEGLRPYTALSKHNCVLLEKDATKRPCPDGILIWIARIGGHAFPILYICIMYRGI